MRSVEEKVAILLLALGEPLGAKLLQNLDPADVRRIMDCAGSLEAIGRDDLERLIDEFSGHFAKSLGLNLDFQQVRNLAETAFPEGELERLLGQPRIVPREPVWSSFNAGSENMLVPYLLDEHPQTVAFVVSSLRSELAATCLAMLPRELRDSVTRRLLKLQPVREAASQILQDALQEDLLAKADSGQEEEGRKRLAALMNKMDRSQSTAILDSLMKSRPDEARELRKLIFAFEDIEQLSQPARLALFDKVQTERVIAALRGMPAEFKEAVLSSMGARARRMVEAELQGDTGQVTRDVIAARREIADLAIAMAARGELALPAAHEADTQAA
jgi:flagellar motor switch protein FliG